MPDDASIDAIAALLVDHVPPVVVSRSGEVLPLQHPNTPVIGVSAKLAADNSIANRVSVTFFFMTLILVEWLKIGIISASFFA